MNKKKGRGQMAEEKREHKMVGIFEKRRLNNK